MNGCKFTSEIRNASITMASLKLMHKVLEEHLENLSENGMGTDWGNYIYEDMKELAAPADIPNAIFSIFLHHELVNTLKDWSQVMLHSNHIEFETTLEETFEIECAKEKS